MSDIKLSPCPCCGGKGKIKERIGGYFPFYAILCDCGLRTKDMPSPELAAEIWNTRKPIEKVGLKVRNRHSGKAGVVLREWESGSIQVLESVEPFVICTHDSWSTLEVIDD